MNEKNSDYKNTDWVSVGNYLNKMPGLVSVLANFFGALFVTLYFTYFDNLSAIDSSLTKDLLFPLIMFIFLVLIGVVIFRKWFQPLDKLIKQKIMGQKTDAQLLKVACRKILNLPLMASLSSMFNWVLASIIMSGMVFFNEGTSPLSIEIFLYVFRTFIGIIIGGIVTSATIFFLMENLCRKVTPYFFPSGGLTEIKGVFRLSLKMRIMITFVFASFFPIIDLALLSYTKAREMTGGDPDTVLSNLGLLIIFVLFVDLFLAVILSHLLARIIVKPVMEMKNAMEQVEQGNLTANVKVSDNNELGKLADNFNKMTEGLRDRYQIKQSLSLARDVQQDLLPGRAPEIEGLDIAGKIIYSDETGGDYYDYIYPNDPSSKRIGLVVGDVSEHGISSALLMASTRAFIRQRVALPGNIKSIITDVNLQFSRDVGDSGRFMTLFFLSVEYGKKSLEWVRAGHDPAILYDPVTNSFEALKGKGVALGIDGDFQYTEYNRKGFDTGQIVVLATDGLWESKNDKGEMFGKKSIQAIIKKNKNRHAKEILDSLIERVEVFTKSKIPEDDITLVVLKKTAA